MMGTPKEMTDSGISFKSVQRIELHIDLDTGNTVPRFKTFSNKYRRFAVAIGTVEGKKLGSLIFQRTKDNTYVIAQVIAGDSKDPESFSDQKEVQQAVMAGTLYTVKEVIESPLSVSSSGQPVFFHSSQLRKLYERAVRPQTKRSAKE